MPVAGHGLLRWSAIALLVFGLFVAALYAATPAIVARMAPTIGERFGLAELEIDIDYPGLHSVVIRRLALATDQVRLIGSDAHANYRLSELLGGRLDRLAFEELAVTVSAADDTQAAPASPVDTAILAPPIGNLSVEKLSLRLMSTGFVGVGTAELGDGVLSFAMDGMAPEAASRLSLSATLASDGVFNARFAERGDAGMDYLKLDGTLGASLVSLNGMLNLRGFALALTSELLGLPAGSGSAMAEFRTSLPWPLPDAGQWPAIRAEVPAFSVDWTSADAAMSIKAVRGAVTIDGQDITGSVGGDVLWGDAQRSISMSLPDTRAFSIDNGTISGFEGLRLRVTDTGLDADAVLQSVMFAPGTETRLDIDGEVSAKVDETGVKGRFEAQLVAQSVQTPRGTSRLEFTGTLARDGRRHSGSILTRLALDGTALGAAGVVTSGIFDTVPFILDYDLESSAGTFSATKLLVLKRPLAKSLVPGWDSVYDLDSGRIDWSVEANWRTPETIAAHLVLAIDNGVAHYDDYRASGISTVLDFYSADAANVDGWTLKPARVNAQTIDVGLPVTNARMGLGWSGDRVDISDMQVSLLGGRAIFEDFTYRIASGSADFELRLEDLDLAAVLALEGEDIVGTGKLDGILPVSIRNNEPGVQGGKIVAQPPGGTIRLTSSFAGPTGQAGLDFAVLALKNFNYSDLRAQANYAGNGDLALAVQLKGRNPEVEKGRAIQYNLSISENIPTLLESLRLDDRLSESVEKRVKK